MLQFEANTSVLHFVYLSLTGMQIIRAQVLPVILLYESDTDDQMLKRPFEIGEP